MQNTHVIRNKGVTKKYEKEWLPTGDHSFR